MENVVAFNNELSGLYDTKPPISKAKMAAITKSAMRAIKFYKHVVQSVEKFILKCKAEYKVPGLYVIDSIVRQSRHQYGPEKDVFAPRFARNITETFANLFRCAPEDKSRIIRVLNLWQKNNVFAPEVIQPIFDLADPNHPIYQMPPSGVSNAPSGSSGIGDMASSTSNGLNTSSGSMDINNIGGSNVDEKIGGLPDLSNNNLKQLLNDPNVLRQLQTLQNFQKFKQEEKQNKLNEMRLQEEAFEKHLQNVLKGSGSSGGQDASDFNKEVEFVSEEQKIEVINLDGNDSRSPTPDRDRYKRRRSRSRSRDRSGRDRDRDRRRRSRSRSRSRSPRSNRRRTSRERDRSDRSNRDKEKDREHERERRKKGLPDIKKEHLSVCSTTLWVGHLSKLVYQEELSDTFGEYGDIVSIDQIIPRGCAFIVMNRRQDAYKAMQSLKNHKLQGRGITISWAAGKGVKSKEWKDFWDLELGVTYIPWNKIDTKTDFDSLEEGGMFDEDSMPGWMKDKINHSKSLKEKTKESTNIGNAGNNILFSIDTTQPPPGPPPPIMPMVPGQFSMAPPLGAPPRMLGPMGMPMPGIPMAPNLVPGMPPPHAMMMPAGMMPPGFPPNPNQVGIGGPMGPPHIAALASAGTPFHPPGAPPQATNVPPSSSGLGNLPGDDQMDIEMEVDDATTSIAPSTASSSQPNFNQPPPLFPGGSNAVPGSGNDTSNDIFNRDRNRPTGGSSRWGRNDGGNEDGPDGPPRWMENGGAAGPSSFNDNRGGGGRNGGPMNIPPLDLNNPPQRPDFINEFNRGGQRSGGRGGNHNSGDFYPNMQNRFNQPTSLLQMRIPPPNSFNPRLGGPMFMRGQGGGGNRQQGQGFFNNRNPFDRDGVGRVGRGGGRGSNRGSRGGNGPNSGIWSDDEGDNVEGNNFKRRGPAGNRFRDDDRHNRDRGGRRGMGGDRSRDRHDRERHESDRNGRRNSRDEQKQQTNNVSDTEEDWDRELQEYDAKSAAAEKMKSSTKNDEDTTQLTTINKAASTEEIHNENVMLENPVNDEPQIFDEKRKEEPFAVTTTPLYDELPAPSNVTINAPTLISSSCSSPQHILPSPTLDCNPSDNTLALVVAETTEPIAASFVDGASENAETNVERSE